MAVESERRKICFFFFHLFERKIAKKVKIDAFGDCKAQLFFFLMLIIAEWMLSKLRINIEFFYKF